MSFKPVEAWAQVSKTTGNIATYTQMVTRFSIYPRKEEAEQLFSEIKQLRNLGEVEPCLVVPAAAVVFESAEEFGKFMNWIVTQRAVGVWGKDFVKLLAEWRKSREGEK